MIILTPRLMKAAEYAVGAERIIDVGCDHGYLSAYMVTAGGASFAYACDVNEGPLCKARETVEQLGIEDKVKTVLCNGLCNFQENDADTVFICGMGGELISEILSAAPWTSNGKHKLILQPMTRNEKLRMFLQENGYQIIEECFVKEDFRLYCLMSVIGGYGDCGKDNIYLFSNNVVRDENFFEYVNLQLNKFRIIAEEKEKAGHSATYERDAIKVLEDCNAC